MKRFVIVFLLITILMTTLLPATSFAKTGDIIGYAKYTDISAYINHYPITSYNINNYTAVVAEDLKNYGFDVIWNGDSRTLSITRNNSATAINPDGTIYKYSSVAGRDSFPYLETDIKTYVNGNCVESFNINGQTCIYIDSLAPYGEVVWLPETRDIKLWIDGLPINDYASLEEAPVTVMYSRDGRTIIVENSKVQEYEAVGWYISPLHAKYNYYPNAYDIPTFDSVTGNKFKEKQNNNYYLYQATNNNGIIEYRDILTSEFGWECYDWNTKKETKIINNTIKQVTVSMTLWFEKGERSIAVTNNYQRKYMSVHLFD